MVGKVGKSQSKTAASERFVSMSLLLNVLQTVQALHDGVSGFSTTEYASSYVASSNVFHAHVRSIEALIACQYLAPR